jgi:hypothetical protein
VAAVATYIISKLLAAYLSREYLRSCRIPYETAAYSPPGEPKDWSTGKFSFTGYTLIFIIFSD